MTSPPSDDICYATQNRQEVVKQIAPDCDLVIVVGSKNSSNSVRLVEVARAAGCPQATLVQNAATMDWRALDGVTTVAMSAGASAPEELVEELIEACGTRFVVSVTEVEVVKEDVFFKTPPIPLRHAS